MRITVNRLNKIVQLCQRGLGLAPALEQRFKAILDDYNATDFCLHRNKQRDEHWICEAFVNLDTFLYSMLEMHLADWDERLDNAAIISFLQADSDIRPFEAFRQGFQPRPVL